MKISQLPADVREKALKHQAESKGYDKRTDDLVDAFYFQETIEGYYYWRGWKDKEYSPIQDVAALRLETPDNDEFCKKIDELIKKI